ncbi:hypothetical protein GCM10017673_26870 [Streptosporangium violaceochromogenes]|nr:hypothetical protein GCM10017673_26870 [Streptosporangium violaceochromogenes]
MLAPAVGMATLVGADTANAETTGAYNHPIVGTWQVDILFPVGSGNPPEKGLFLFTGTNLVICTNTRVRDLGLGKWDLLDPFRFSFTFRHHMFMPDGTWGGTLDIAHSGSASGNTFTSSGTGKAYDTNGKPTDSVSSRIAGVRY